MNYLQGTLPCRDESQDSLPYIVSCTTVMYTPSWGAGPRLLLPEGRSRPRCKALDAKECFLLILLIARGEGGTISVGIPACSKGRASYGMGMKVVSSP